MVAEIIRYLLPILGPLIAVVIVLIVTTLVGHGLWLGAAVLLRAIVGRSRAKRPGRQCVFCGRTSHGDAARCEWCGRELDSALAQELADLDALVRQLQRLGRCGLVDQAQCGELIVRAMRYRTALIHGQALAAPASLAPPEAPAAGLAPPAAAQRPPPREVEPREEPLEAILVEPQKPAPAAPSAPRRSWGELVAAFMEERNIRWGELIGGLLIVGSSIALVLSLWDTLREIRYFPFLIFVAATAALFFVGLYAHHRWRLAATSRGVLMIAGLLVPLNFLALAALSARQWTWPMLAMEAGALGLFAWLGLLAGCVLMPGKARLGVLAVAGPSAALAVGAHTIGPETGLWWYLLIAGVPAGCLLGAVAGWLRGLSAAEREQLDVSQVAALATLVAGGSFAAVVAWGLLVARSDALLLGLNRLAPLVVLGAAAPLGAGLALRRGTAHGRQLAGWHVAGTSTMLAATAVMLAAVALAWPQPAVLVAVGLLVFGVLAAAGLKWQTPALHGPALGAAVAAVLIAFHVLWHGLPWLVEPGSGFGSTLAWHLLESSSAAVLAGVFLVVCAVTEVFVRRAQRPAAAVYAGGGVVIALVALSLAGWHGLAGAPHQAACALAVFGACAAGSLGLAARWRRAELLYAALALAGVAPLWELWRRSPRVEPAWAAVLAGQALLMALAAVGLELWERLLTRRFEATDALRPHAPVLAWQLGEPVPAEGSLARFVRIGTVHISALLACAALVLAMVVAFAHVVPGQPRAWWPGAAVLGVALSMGLVAFWSGEGIFVYISGLLVDGAVILAWPIWQEPSVAGFVRVNALALAAGSLAWSLVGLFPRLRVPGVPLGPRADRHSPISGQPQAAGFAPLAAQWAVWLAAVLVAWGIAGDLGGGWPPELRVAGVERLDWLMLGAAAAALGLLLWDAAARWPLAGVYLLVLVAEGMWLRWRSYPAPWTYIWAPVNELAAIVLLSALAGWLRRWSVPVQQILRIPARPGGWATGWFAPAQALLAAAVAMQVMWIAVDFRFNGCGQGLPLILFIGRGHATTAALMLLGGAIVMAWQYAGSWRRAWQYAAFALGLVFTSSIGLASLDATPGSATAELPWLHRAAIIMLSSTMLTMLAAFGLRLVFARTNDWLEAGRRASPMAGRLALFALGATLAQETWAFWLRGDVPMAGWAAAIVAAALAGLIAVCLLSALFGRWDPLHLSDRGRTAYVYAAEALAVAAGLHLWLVAPWIFALDIFERWWMLWVMAGAFAGAGLAELFRARGLPVLAQPLANTALALPLLPAVGCWFVEPGAGWLGLTGHTPLVWFVIALFYGMMAAVHRSLWLSAAAILSGNMGLWVFWQRQDLSFVDHPQLWLIPPAMGVLAAEMLDRRRLNENQRAALRYVALGVIYLSSMTESWRGLAAAPLLPLVTILLALAGVVLGILLRVRAFLYLGFACLVVIISRLIYFAAIEQGHMWVLWACCMLLGAAILALFALFEKRRNEIRSAFERLKRWEK